MWFFRSSDNSLYYFWEKQCYTVGRKNTDIVISNDESISRSHAEIQIELNNVYLTDKSSKYGTFLNGAKLKPNERQILKENDQIKFGALENTQSKFKLEKLNFEVVTSNVKSADKRNLQDALNFLDASRVNLWSKTCTHLVISEVILTSKVLCALTEDQPIVTDKYFRDYIKSVKNNTNPPNVKDYLPEINESLLSKNIKLEYHPGRRTLFKDKTFVFLTEKTKVQMTELITVTGGKAISWEKNKLNIDTIKKDNSNYLFLEENLDNINQNTEMYKSFLKCVNFLFESGKRSIPLQEIALAIVHNSCDENCNPLFNRVGLLIANTPSTQNSEKILVYDSEQPSATSTQKDSEIPTMIVMPSYDDIDVSPIENNSFKRPLDIDSSEEKPRKKNKEEIQNRFKSISKNFNDENTKSQSSQNDSTNSNLFSFKRPNSSNSTNNSKNSAFNFPVSMSTPKPKPVEDKIEDENPFMRKRKATKDIAPAPKKIPLENISNKEKTNIKPNTILPKQSFNDTTVKSELSTIIKSNTWLSKTSVKKEIIDEIQDVKVKVEDDFDDAILKLNEQFKNSIRVEFMPLIVKNENISFDIKDQHNNSNQVNFKKFKKNNVPKYQTIIITDDQMAHFVVGEAVCHNISDDDEVETPDMDMVDIPVARNPAPKRARFQFGA